MADTKWYMRQVDRSWLRLVVVILIPLLVAGVVATQWKGWAQPVSCPDTTAVLLRVAVNESTTADGTTITRTLSTDCDWHSSKALTDAVGALTEDLDGATTTTVAATTTTTASVLSASTTSVASTPTTAAPPTTR